MREKDIGTPMGDTFGNFVSADPWFKDTVLDVSFFMIVKKAVINVKIVQAAKER